MPVNKVEYFGNTLLDLTGDNVTPSDVKKGVVFHDATGAQQIGEGAGLDVHEQTNSSGGKTVYINSEPEKLPEGFTRLKYIQSDGRQYVDTGINSTYTLELDIAFTNTGSRNLMGRSTEQGCYFGANASGFYELGGNVVSKYSGFSRRRVLVVDTDADISITIADETISRVKTSDAVNQIELRLLGGFADYPCSATMYGGKAYLVRKYDYVRYNFAGNNTIGYQFLVDGKVETLRFANSIYWYNTADNTSADATPEMVIGWMEMESIKNAAYSLRFVNGKISAVIRYSLSSGTVGTADTDGRWITLSGSSSQIPYRSSEVWSATAGEDIPAAGDSIEYVLRNGIIAAMWVAGTPGNDVASVQRESRLTRNYIPCLNASGEAGLWDTVTQAFFGDAAGVGFIAGPVVLDYELPEGFEELAWIESDGRQYVDTGVTLSSATIPNLRVVADAELVLTSGAWIISGSAGSFPMVFFGVNASGKISYGNGSEIVNTSEAYTQGRYTWDYDLKNKRFIVGGTQVSGITTNATGSVSRNFFISACSTSTEALCHEEFIFGYQFYDNGTIVRYYVPCRTNTGEVGLWDVANSVFYGDAAGVGFIAGPKKGVSKVVLEDEVLIDLTGDTVTAEGLLAGLTAHDASGAQIIGELVQKSGYQVATGTYSGSSVQTTVTISGLPFKPTNMLLALDGAGNPARLSAHVITVSTDTKNFVYGYDAGLGTSNYVLGSLSNVSVYDGSIAVTIPFYTSDAGTQIAFRGNYKYVVWGE